MSTEYYKLRKPFTHLALAPGIRDELQVWIDGEAAGVLAIASRHTKEILRTMFLEYPPALHTYWGGRKGAVVTIHEPLADDAVILSEYGDLMTVAQVKARAGATRQDGMPTELFGYEDAAS